MTTVADILAKKKPRRRIVRLCLDGEVAAEWEDVSQRLAAQAATKQDSMAGSSEARRLRKRLAELAAAMQESTAEFVVQALDDEAYRALAAEHPPRKTAKGDVLTEDQDGGVNSDTFYLALLRASLVDPVVSTDDEWSALAASLSNGEMDKLASAAFVVNRGVVDVPFSVAVSSVIRDSGDGSRSQSD